MPGSVSPVVPDFEAWDGVVSGFVDVQRRRAALDAEEIRLLGGAMKVVIDAEASYRRSGRRGKDIPYRSLVCDLATATGWSELTVKRVLGDAVDLCDRFEPVLQALAEGRITRRHAAVIQDSGVEIEDDTVRAEYVALVLARAEQTTPGRLGPVAAAISARLNPISIDERHERANERRGVSVRDLPDAMSDLVLRMPSVLAHAAVDRATQFAQSVVDGRADLDEAAEPVDTRTMDQLRADAMADLLLTGTPATCTDGDALSAVRATVQLTVPVLTAAGVGDEPSLLCGVGPIDTATATRLLGSADQKWLRVMTSPVTGAVLCVDRYKPGKPLKQLLDARDERCRFPGCRRPAQRCEKDHTIPYLDGGATCVCNLENLCAHHHVIKHHGEWTVVQLPGGVLEWTSPTGRRSTDRPEPTVRFVPDRDLDIDPPPEPVIPGSPRHRRTDPDGYFTLQYRTLPHGPVPF